MNKLQQLFVGVAALGLAGAANATLISGTSLQDGLNARTQGGAFLDVNADQLSSDLDQVWTIGASGASVNVLVFEFAGFSGTNTFGIYDVTDTTKKLEIFNGAASAGEIIFTQNGGTTTFENVNTSATTTFASMQFGYYLGSGNGSTYYSQNGLNPSTDDHMVAFAGGTGLNMDISPPTFTGPYASFGAGEYILAWEDLDLSGADDYDDMVVLVESVTPVPEPSVLALLGAGLLGLGLSRRRT